MTDPDTHVSRWRPSRPLPFYLIFGRCRCECGRKFRNEQRYNEHWDAEHEADAFTDPNHPDEQGGSVG